MYDYPAINLRERNALRWHFNFAAFGQARLRIETYKPEFKGFI